MTGSLVEVHALSPERLPQFLSFFEGSAFSDNPKWSFCYCQCFFEDHSKIVWRDRTAAENRAHACRRIAEASMQGYLASVDGEVAGWCCAGPRRLFHALDDEPIADAESVGQIMCFLVAPAHRGKGIARALLDAACDGLRAQGLAFAEANPRPAASSAAENHFGPLRLYLSAGFSIDRSDPDGSVHVRRKL